MRVLSIGASAVVACIVASNAFAAVNKPSTNLPNFSKVSDYLYRGGQPTKLGMEELRARGVRTILSLRDSKTQVVRERMQAKSLGLNFKVLPLGGIQKPTKEVLKKFVQIVQDPVNQPIFVHCDQGLTRTGVMIALYREQVQNWSAKRAYDEMMAKGFDSRFVWLADTVFDYEEDKLGSTTKKRPVSVKVFDSVESVMKLRPDLKDRD